MVIIFRKGKNVPVSSFHKEWLITRVVETRSSSSVRLKSLLPPSLSPLKDPFSPSFSVDKCFSLFPAPTPQSLSSYIPFSCNMYSLSIRVCCQRKREIQRERERYRKRGLSDFLNLLLC